jgi:predicted CoA-binding protein
MNKTTDIIAKAIQEADNSYFSEDYGKQAAAVIKALEKKGLMIVPATPSEEAIKFALDNMPYGKVKPELLITNVYTAVLNAFKAGK